jgi:hypothetical protein
MQDDVCYGGQWLLIGFLVGSRNREEMILSHLLFVDDTLIFCDPSC